MDTKPFKTLENQIQILKSRNLLFLEEQTAYKVLSTYGYYEIINGYKEAILEKKDGNEEDRFVEGATFEQLFSLFKMDKSIASCISKTMHELELHLRTTLAYVVAKHYTAEYDNYTNRNNYTRGAVKWNSRRHKNESERDQLLRKFEKIKNDDIQPFKHYREYHGNIPPWILLKGTTFGNLITFYRLLKGSIKTEVICLMTDIPVELINDDFKQMFSEMLYMFLAYRNRADHGGRVYNYQSDKNSMKYHEVFHSRLKMGRGEFKDGKGRCGIDVLMCALSWFNTHGDLLGGCTINIYQALMGHLDKFPNDKEFININTGSIFSNILDRTKV